MNTTQLINKAVNVKSRVFTFKPRLGIFTFKDVPVYNRAMVSAITKSVKV